MVSWAGALGVLGAAVLFALFGWLTRGRRPGCGRDGAACPAPGATCGACGAEPTRLEGAHGRH